MYQSTIQKLSAREILDSRGNPTVEVRCVLQSGIEAAASVPSGASTGVHEAVELRDGDPARFGGQGVLRAIKAVTGEIQEKVLGTVHTQISLDEALIGLDGTPNKARLGANAILGVSLAFARACATEQALELHAYLQTLSGTTPRNLPQPMFNIINGGKHADSGLDIQEFMIGPVDFPTLAEKVRAAAEVTAALRKILKAKNYAISIGDEGGFAPKLASNEEALKLIVQAIQDAGYTTAQIKIGIDAAASSFYEHGAYRVKVQGEQQSLDSAGMIEWYRSLVQHFPIMSIEDGFAEDDWEGFTKLTQTLGNTVVIVGDDLTVTNIERIETAAEKNAINSVLIKPNQIGTLTETIRAIQLTAQNGWSAFASHRSGETTDTFIADLAAGLGCAYIKSGAPVRGERVCKYNRLMEIEQND